MEHGDLQCRPKHSRYILSYYWYACWKRKVHCISFWYTTSMRLNTVLLCVCTLPFAVNRVKMRNPRSHEENVQRMINAMVRMPALCRNLSPDVTDDERQDLDPALATSLEVSQLVSPPGLRSWRAMVRLDAMLHRFGKEARRQLDKEVFRLHPQTVRSSMVKCSRRLELNVPKFVTVTIVANHSVEDHHLQLLPVPERVIPMTG